MGRSSTSMHWSGERLLDGEVAVLLGKEGSEWGAAKELLSGCFVEPNRIFE